MKKNIDWETIASLLESGELKLEDLSPEEVEEFRHAQKLWKDASLLGQKRSATPPLSLEKAKEQMWMRITQDMQEDIPLPTTVVIAKTRTLWPSIAAVAATILLPLTAYLFWPSQNDPSRFDGLLTAEASSSKQDISLPDGSNVSLQSGTISYSFDQSTKSRKLSLSGEGFFDIARNEQFPFVIESKNTLVTVLGTSFQLDALPADNAPIKLSVTSGKVAFKANDLPNWGNVYASQGEQVVYHPSQSLLQKTFADNEHYISFQNGYIALDATLGEVISFIANGTGANISCADSSIAQMSLTSTQGVAYSDPYTFLQRIILPIADVVSISQEDDRSISIQRK